MEAGFKACPYCAEPIREAARVCRYCNRELAAPNRRSTPRTPARGWPLGRIISWLVVFGLVAVVMAAVPSPPSGMGRNSAFDFLIVAATAVGPLILLSLYRRRHAIGHRFRIIIRAEIAYLVPALLLLKLGQPPSVAILVGFICGLIVGFRAPRRSRYIPRLERRKAIAKFELTGRRFDPRIHEIDHVIPFAKGGSNTAENLRVIEREANRAKSAKSPWWDLLGR